MNRPYDIAAYGAAPLDLAPHPIAPASPPTDRSWPTDFSMLIPTLSRSAKASIREQVKRLTALRLSPAVTDPATRAELDSIIGALTVAVEMP